METFFKRYFWTVGLVLTAAIALLNGKAISNTLGTLLIREPGKLTIVRPRAATGPKVKKSTYIEARNLFNSAATADEMPDLASVSEGLDVDSDQVPESDLSLILMGTIFSSDPLWSIALIQDGSETRLFQIGQKIKADAELIGVWAEEAWVRRADGRVERIKSEAGSKSGKAPYSSSSPRTTSSSPSSSKSKTARFKEGIKRKSSYEYEITRSLIDEQLSDLNKLGTQARIIPHYKDGKANGFKLVGIRPGSLYSHIGIRSGDVIRAVNGMEINSPTKALKIYEKLKNSNELSVSLDRRGTKKDISYKITP